MKDSFIKLTKLRIIQHKKLDVSASQQRHQTYPYQKKLINLI